MSVPRKISLAEYRRRKEELEQAIATVSAAQEQAISSKCDAVVPTNGTSVDLATVINSSGVSNGIWQNLLVNMAILAVALVMFIILKKKMFNQDNSRRRTTERWANLMYGSKRTEPGFEEDDPERWRWYSWLTNTLSESDYQLLRRGGLGALEYVQFQRTVLWYSIFICVMTILIVLPANLNGDLFLDNMARASLSNLKPTSNYLWIHVVFSVLLFPVAFLAMRSYGMNAADQPSRNRTSSTVMFSGLPTKRANTENLTAHFREAYPGYELANVALSYDTRNLRDLEKRLQLTEEALDYCIFQPEGSEGITINTRSCCGGSCGCCGNDVDAEKYYALERSKLHQRLELESRHWKRVNPVFFVTFGNAFQAQQVCRDYERCSCCRQKPQTNYSKELKASRWTAYMAPHPATINWDNLSSSGFGWFLRAVLVNLFLFGLVVGLAFLVVILDFTALPKLQKLSSHPGLSQILPAIALVVVQLLVPPLMAWGVKIIGYWSTSKETVAEMRYIFADLLLAVLLLPSLGLLIFSAAYFSNGPSSPGRPECISLPDNGSVYIHYLIFFAFLVTAFSLFRLKLIFQYLIRACSARSEAEKALAAKVEVPFAFGEEYPQFLTAFAITIAYTITSPLLALFGVLAMTMKYFLDQYMLCNTYKRSVIPNSVHGVAIRQFFAAVLLQLFMVLVLFVLRNGFDAKAIVLALAFFLYTALFVGMLAAGACQKVSLFGLSDYGEEVYPEELDDNAQYTQPSGRRSQGGYSNQNAHQGPPPAYDSPPRYQGLDE